LGAPWQAIADIPLQFGQPLQRHRRRAAFGTEVERLLIEAGLSQHQVTVWAARTPLREALRDAIDGFGEGEQRVAVLRCPLKYGDGHATNTPWIVLGTDFTLVDEAGCGSFGTHPPVDGF